MFVKPSYTSTQSCIVCISSLEGVKLTTLVVIRVYLDSYHTMAMITAYFVDEVLLYIHQVNICKNSIGEMNICARLFRAVLILLCSLCIYIGVYLFLYRLFVRRYLYTWAFCIRFTQVTRCYCGQFTIKRIAHQLFIDIR